MMCDIIIEAIITWFE